MNPALTELIRVIDQRDRKGLERLCVHFGSYAAIKDLAKRALIDVDTLEEMLYEIS